MTDRTEHHDILRGFFDVIENRLQVSTQVSMPVKPTHPIAKAHAALIAELARIQVPQISVYAESDEFEAVADYIRRVTDLFDVTWLQQIGIEVAANALCRVDQAMFCNQFVGAVSGNATYELDCCAEAAREAQAEDDDYDADRADDEYDERQSW